MAKRYIADKFEVNGKAETDFLRGNGNALPITKAEIEAKLIGEITSHTHPASGGLGDMVLATDQTVSGLKTFLYDKLGMRNAANTFTSFFRNANTAVRYYTLPNKDGTVAMTSDIIAQLNGTINYLVKFGTATTGVVSRIWDTGTFLGIGTANTPTKDITLGNQGNKEIGVELSNSSIKGRDLTVSAGKTINYQLTAEFISLNQTIPTNGDMTSTPNGDVYIANGVVSKQTNGTGDFIDIGANVSLNGIAYAPNGDMYGCALGGNIYKRTNNTGLFVSLGQVVRNYNHMTADANNNIYVTVKGSGDIYKQTNGTGDFIALGQTLRDWRGITATPSGDIYASVSTGDLYKQTNGTGNFIALGLGNKSWEGLTSSNSGNVYGAIINTGVVVLINGIGSLVALSGSLGNSVNGMTVSSVGNVYVCNTTNGKVHMQNNNALGTPNIDGGTLIHKAGTGKGTGKSRYQIVTGQKTVSGTDMQVETVRAEFDESGNYTRFSTPTFADNASAIAGGLTVGMEYKTATGVKMEVY